MDKLAIEDILSARPMDLVSRLGTALKASTNDEMATTSNKDRIRVFLSYARPDADLVAGLFDKLSADNFAPWMDVKSILPGEKWITAIEAAIKRAHFFLLCLSPHSINRRGVLQREIRIAFEKLNELLDDDIYFVPVRFGDYALPARISEYQAVDLSKDDGYVRLVHALKEGFLRRTKGTK